MQTRDCPHGRDVDVDAVVPPYQDPVQYVIHCLESGVPVDGPLSPAIARIGQQIVDTAVLSSRERRTVALITGF